MKKKLRLRNWVKTTIIIIMLLIVTVLFLNIANSRVEQIENGELTIINENQMRERK